MAAKDAGKGKGKEKRKSKPLGPGTDSSPKALVEKAYRKVDEKLEQGDTKVIDDLVKLMKLEKEMDGEKQSVEEIRVRWEPSDESSSEG